MKLLTIIISLFFIPNYLVANTDYFNEGVKFFINNEFEKAKFKFEQDIVFNPKNENSYLYLSKIFKKEEKKDLEERNLSTVLKLNPRNEEAVYNLASLKLNNSDFSESKKLVEQLLTFCEKYCQKSKELKSEIDNSIKK